jgi:hypothetical protein
MGKCSKGMSLDCKSKSNLVLICSAFFLVCLASALAPAAAQDNAKPEAEKWRPKDGLYAEPGPDLGERCMDHNEVIVELADKSISGDEWNCRISKLADVAPGSVRLDATCTELEHKPYKTVFLLKKIDDRTVFYGASTKGKKDPGRQMSFCPEEGQRQYAAAKARDLAEARRKTAEESAKPPTEKWRPKDGLYAGSANFNNKCQDSPDLFLELAKKMLSAGGEELCKIVKLANTAPDAITLDVTCTDIERETPYKKIILLKKIDETTIFWRATADAKLKFTYPGVRVSYCPEEAQRAYIDSKKIK